MLKKEYNQDFLLNSSNKVKNKLKKFKSAFANPSNDVAYFYSRTDKVCTDLSVTPDLVIKYCNLLDCTKSPGNDQISANILMKCAKALAVPLSLLFNKILSSGVLPIEWREANITSLFKNGSRLDAGNYRPVSLTSTCCKLMERMVKDHVMEHLTANDLISKSQHGFVNKRACYSNLLESLDYVTNAGGFKC